VELLFDLSILRLNNPSSLSISADTSVVWLLALLTSSNPTNASKVAVFELLAVEDVISSPELRGGIVSTLLDKPLVTIPLSSILMSAKASKTKAVSNLLWSSGLISKVIGLWNISSVDWLSNALNSSNKFIISVLALALTLVKVRSSDISFVLSAE